MPRYNMHGRWVIADTLDLAYAKRFECSVAEAIGDRDIPMTREQCEERFFESEGRAPTPEEMDLMHPESISEVIEALRFKGL